MGIIVTFVGLLSLSLLCSSQIGVLITVAIIPDLESDWPRPAILI